MAVCGETIGPREEDSGSELGPVFCCYEACSELDGSDCSALVRRTSTFVSSPAWLNDPSSGRPI